MRKAVSTYIPAVFFLLTVLFITLFPQPFEYLKQFAENDGVFGYIVFVLLLIVATVCMPLTVMPMIPMSAAVLGPLPTALLSIIGWTLGATIAFLVSRYVGRPVLERFFPMDKIDSLTKSFSSRSRFWSIVLLRMTVPVDIASYALGLVPSIRLSEYIAATLLGVTWFSFAFAYLGDALLTGNTPLLIELGTSSLLIFIAGWYILRRTHTKKSEVIQQKSQSN